MSRYRGARLRVVRRLGDLPGLTRKSPRKAYPPGQHGQERKKKSEYGVRLEEKQKLRFNYGITERQLLRYVRKARRAAGSTGQTLLQLLEMRLDNTVFRLGMAPTIPAARQLVNHGHITVNGRPVDIASYQCRPGEVIGVRDRDRSRQLIEQNLQYPGLAHLPSHLEFDKGKLTGKVNGVIEREWIALQVNELLVVEYYSRQA
ncbi:MULTISPECIES: 30S ribosomal protein S4 [Trichocoleus]|uniref:Small ribosomal subunit protein uS4 n=1 Tax=Trichocoleus desertorum GB2-A4 TaxID=2933944 RepID=A0ABV0J465_9CYAN|nr:MULTISPECIES: 30S ribosomal protein S4 [unclassified Trichocoleus]MBD1861917.1 30S ribosomal protein S4 [Trichocoleus sp. FACHB-46]MBD2098089.1 30S ribosomal protein S4 [Trichocoleus sp. FACHB-591]MBD2123023.1 30S ribosomal protein S4 [Trichocoleus sp. FACHB-262]MBW4486881.1 30S ribosomal protein S4 [Trichocoleus desertorum ATA4-8-CV12]